jgi:uncharacterized membrane protein
MCFAIFGLILLIPSLAFMFAVAFAGAIFGWNERLVMGLAVFGGTFVAAIVISIVVEVSMERRKRR